VAEPVALRVDGLESVTELYWLLLGNTRSYGGVVDIASSALADDGLLDLYSFSGRRRTWVVRTALRLALRRHHGADGVDFRRTRSVEVLTPGLPVQADGEYLGETPMSFGIAPGALSLLVPAGQGAKLFSQPSFDGFRPA
jgi:diacylglycerol kinase family enzyme